MSWYIFSVTGKNTWKLHPADSEEEVLREKPEFTTVLQVNHSFEEGLPEPSDLKYRGPLYLDWDGEDEIEDVLVGVKDFMGKLESKGFDLDEASWFLTGKKGFHCTIPMECLVSTKATKEGVVDLPLIYKRMMFSEPTEYLDLSIYSRRRGRMWRVPNNPREVNGKTTHKVQIAPEQLKNLDTEGYWAWCSQERPEILPKKSTMNRQLATDFSVARDYVKVKGGNLVKTSLGLFKGYKGIPPTIEAAFGGEISSEANLNDIALQFAAAAHELGITDVDVYIEKLEGFIESRIGKTGSKHRTRKSIVSRLKQTFEGISGDSSYPYSPAAFASILPKALRGSDDLKGTTPGEKTGTKAKAVSDLSGGITVKGDSLVWVRPKEEDTIVADYAWEQGSTSKIMSADGTRITHYSFVPIVDGVARRREIQPLEIFHNQNNFGKYLMGLGGTSTLSSTAKMANALKALRVWSTDGNIKTLTAVSLEGIHLVPVEGGKPHEFLRFWVQPNATIPAEINSKYKGLECLPTYMNTPNPQGIFGSDLAEAEHSTLSDNALKETVHNLLEIQDNLFALATLIGWFTACNLKHILYEAKQIENFPLLQIVGEAGSGKTTAANSLMHLFTYRKTNKVASAPNLTKFAIDLTLSSQTTLPLVIDEIKNAGPQLSLINAAIHTSYTMGTEGLRGGGGSENSGWQTLGRTPSVAPICTIDEHLNVAATAIVERSVVARFTKSKTSTRAQHARWLGVNQSNLGVLGWRLIKQILEIDILDLTKRYERSFAKLDVVLQDRNNERVLQNAAIVHLGFQEFQNFINKLFPETFEDKLKSLAFELVHSDNWSLKSTTEIIKVLNRLAAGSKDEGRNIDKKMRLGYHYAYESVEGSQGRKQNLIISAERAFYVYRLMIRDQNLEAVFLDEAHLEAALSNYAGTIRKTTNEALGGNCFVLDLEVLQGEGVQDFK